MNWKKWMVVSMAIGAIATVAVLATQPPVKVFRTTAGMIALGQGSNSISGDPEYNAASLDGSNLCALALGENPDSNQVFAMSINCDSTSASLIVWDKSVSNSVATVATSTSFDTIVSQGLKSHYINNERFVAQFAVASTGKLAGGTLTVTGRLHLGTNGCPASVLTALDVDPQDAVFCESGVANTDQDGKIKVAERAGRADFIGTLNVVESGSTNTWLLPLGHLSFNQVLDSNLAE
jgi:hypothetical protein